MKNNEQGSYNVFFCPFALERLNTVGMHEAVGVGEVIARSIKTNKILVDQKVKTIKVGNRYEHNFKDGLLQPYNPEFYVVIYDGLFPKMKDMLEIMNQTHKIPELHTDNLLKLELTQNIINIAGVTDVNWKKAIKKSLWNYTEIQFNRVRSIDSMVKMTRTDGSPYTFEYPPIVNRRIDKIKEK